MCCGSKTDNIGRKVTLTASIWYRLYSWELPSLKPKEIVEKIGGNKMNETELKDLSDKILSGELVLDEELEKLLEGFAEFCKKIAEYLENTFSRGWPAQPQLKVVARGNEKPAKKVL